MAQIFRNGMAQIFRNSHWWHLVRVFRKEAGLVQQ